MTHEYIIEQCGDKWCLYNKTKTKILGRHTSKESAQAQERAVHTAEQGYSVLNREIFSVGEHNGDKYNDADLEEMARAFQDLDFLPALKLGHQKDIGAPAYGYASNIRKVGEKLLADFIHLPKDIYDAIKQRRYGRVSAEVFWNLKRAGKLYKRAIGAVALLGQEIPGVAKLKPLYEHTIDDEFDSQLNYALDDNDYNYALELYDASIINADVLEKYAKGDIHAVVNACIEWGGNDFIAKLDKLPDVKNWLLKNHTTGDFNMDPAKMKEYQDQIDALAKSVEDLTTAANAGNDEAKKYKAQADAATKQLNLLNVKMFEKEVKEFSNSITVPALRPFMSALYEVATKAEDTKLKVYAATDKEEELSPVEVLTKMVEYINDKAGAIFREYASGGGKRNDGYDDPAVEVDARVNKYMAEHKTDDYAAALTIVLNADDELKTAYNAI